MSRIFLLMLFYIMAWVGIQAQWCCIDTSMVIPDLSTQSLRFQIKGALINNLANPNQGICGVRLKFEHEYIGDLTADLVSPSGQKVQLTGSVGKSGITKFSQWNVTFLRCSQTAVPDPGFKQKWDNLQPWGILGSYFNGTYYPYGGCLEEFSSGPVNGTWTLVLKDNDIFYTGKLQQFCILFCDNSGINCNTCNANGGYFDSTDYVFCSNDPGLNLGIGAVQPNFIPDPALYGYSYFIIRGDEVMDVRNDLDLRFLGAGSYEICGMSYLLQDSIKLPTQGFNRFSGFRNDVISGKAGICGELSKNCISLIIKPKVPETDLNIKVCSRDTFRIAGNAYTKTGFYTITLASFSGCDSVIRLNIEVTDLNAMIAMPDDLNCSRSNVILDASGSSFPTNAKITWSTLDGNIIDQTDPLRVRVNKKGNYKVVMGNANCIDSAEVTVVNTSNVPELSIDSDTITCQDSVVRVSGSSNVGGVSWYWLDSSGDTVSLANFAMLNKSGRYKAVVVDSRGCSNEINFIMSEDKTPPEFQLSSTAITCKSDSAILSFQPGSKLFSFEWTGPGGFFSKDSAPSVRQAGKYYFTGKASNGCSSTKEVEVLSLVKVPDFSYRVGLLTCKDTVVKIRPTIQAKLKTLTYSGPGGFFTTVFDPEVSVPGRYNVRIVDTSECVLDTFVDVMQDVERSKVRLNAPVLGCGVDSILVNVDILSDPGLKYSFNWSGPIGFSSYAKEAWVKQGAVYYLQITLPNGCVTTDSIKVVEDTNRPRIILTTEQITCNHKKAAITTDVNDGVVFSWKGPGDYVSSSKDIVVDTGGFYKLRVTASNGCFSEVATEVQVDSIPPLTGITPDTLNCKKPVLSIKPEYRGMIDTSIWFAQGVVFSTERNPFISVAGRYKVKVLGRNGCMASDSIDIMLDTATTRVSLLRDSITCIKKIGQLNALPASSGVAYKWISPAGDSSSGASLKISRGGTYRLLATDLNGCSNTYQLDVNEYLSPPVVIISADTLTCIRDTSLVSVSLPDSSINYRWKSPNGNLLFGPSFKTIFPGPYELTAVNQYGCRLTDTIDVISRVRLPVIVFSDSVFNCLNKANAYIEFRTSDILSTYQWIDPQGNVILSQRIDRPVSGLYRLKARDPFDCRFSGSVKVFYDTLNPEILKLIPDTFNCEVKQVLPNLVVKDSSVSLTWSGPSNFNSASTNPVIPQPGRYNLHMEGRNHCLSDTVVDFILDTQVPQFTLAGDSINCANPRGTISVISADSGLLVIWVPPAGPSIIGNPLKTTTSGMFTVEVRQPRNRCYERSAYNLVVDTTSPSIVVRDQSILCRQDSVQLILQTSCSDARILWTKPSGELIESPSPFVRDTGIYKVTVICDNFCNATSSFYVNRLTKLPVFSVDTPAWISCKMDSVQLNVRSAQSDTLCMWSGPGNFISGSTRPFVKEGGVYKLTVRNALGCSVDTSILVSADTVSPRFDIFSLDTFHCSNDTVTIQVKGPLKPDELIQWNAIDGIIGRTAPYEAKVITKGVYKATVTNTGNGCSATRIVSISDSLTGIGKVDLTVTGISCPGESDGLIELSGISGGNGNYKYFIDQIPVADGPVFDRLSAGNHRLGITDRFLCRFDTMLVIPDKAPFTLDIIRDTIIERGNSVDLDILTNMSGITTYQWQPSTGLSCDDCRRPTASPVNTTTYLLTITDSAGCLVTDQVQVRVFLNNNAYVPTIFSPNGDNLNDIFSVATQDGITLIRHFEIFDRWGARVFQLENANPLSGISGWDGTFNGEPSDPGVYVYRIELQDINSAIIQLYGDVTLIR